MPDAISLKTFIDASEVSNGNANLSINKDGKLMAQMGGRAPSSLATAKALSVFMAELTKNFGAHVATTASKQFSADLAGNRPLTGRTVQSIVNEAKSCIERNAMVRNNFMMPDHTGKSAFDTVFNERFTSELWNKIDSELQKNIKGRVMAELLQQFHSKSAGTVTVEAMKDYVAHKSPLLNGVERVCTTTDKSTSFISGSTMLEVKIDQRNKLLLREVGRSEGVASSDLRDPAPGILDPKKAFAHFIRTASIFSGFSPAQVNAMKRDLTSEFKELAKTCDNSAEARLMLTKFTNNQAKSLTMDILKAIGEMPCRSFPGTKDDKIDIARTLFRPLDRLGMQVALEHLADIRKVKPNGPITKEAIWQGVFKEPLPQHLEGPFDKVFGQKLASDLSVTEIRPAKLAILHSLIGSADLPTLLHNPHLPITEKNLHTRHGLSVNTVLKGTDALAADLYRRGVNVNHAPSTILVGGMKLTVGPEPKIDGNPFAFSSDDEKKKYSAGQHSEVTRQLSEAIHNLCGRDGRNAQRELVETLCSQSGLLPFTRMRADLGYAVTEHSPSNITIDKTGSGAVRVHIATPTTITPPAVPGEGNRPDINFEVQNGSIDVVWVVKPDGTLDLEQLTIVRPGKDAEQRPVVPPSLEDVVRNRIAEQTGGLREQARNELTSLVIESAKNKPNSILDPMNPGSHYGPLMRLLEGIHSGLFAGPEANENYNALRRFSSFTLPMGLLLDAVSRAGQEQPGREISREALWMKMYPGFQTPTCTSDADMVKHMEKLLPSFVASEVERMLMAENGDRMAKGQPPLADAERGTAMGAMSSRLTAALKFLSVEKAKEFVAHPHVLSMEHLLAPNMLVQISLNSDARILLTKDIHRRGIMDGGTPTLSVNNTTFTLGKAPKINAQNAFNNDGDLATYMRGMPTAFSKNLLGELRTLCGGRQASQAQVDTVIRCCAQSGAAAFFQLRGMADLAVTEHSSTNIAVSAEQDGNVRVRISTLPELADKGSITYSILVDPAGYTRIDDFIAVPAGVARP